MPTTEDGQANVNGNTVMFSLDGIGYTSGSQPVAFDLANTIIFDMPL